MKLVLFAVGLPVCGLICGSAIRCGWRPTLWRRLQLIGAVCLGVVVLAHFAEAFALLPVMGWGEPHSSGHDLDLAAAALGLGLFPLGYLGDALAGRATRPRVDSPGQTLGYG